VRSRITSHACCRQGVRDAAQGRQESTEPHADRVGAGTPLREHMKGMVLPGTIFEEMGFNYIGPIDGHDLRALVATAHEPARPEGPAVPARDHAQGQGLRARRGRPDQVARSRSVRSQERRHLQGEGERPVVFADLRTMALRHGRAGSRAWSASRPRCAKARGSWNSPSASRIATSIVAIAEQHAVTLAAGMACEGLRPVVAIYSTFLATCVRSADSRRRPAKASGDVRDRPRRPRRRRRRNSPGQLRSLVPAVHSESRR
jgi:deoxyxylulose-5-phosphate synthase